MNSVHDVIIHTPSGRGVFVTAALRAGSGVQITEPIRTTVRPGGRDTIEFYTSNIELVTKITMATEPGARIMQASRPAA
ncbi:MULTISPECIES: hypothetical protein [Nocardioides]|uniref:hypothetical protein n=1 Tax=Nocardioides TaxID=1839 RepID=UPI000CE474F9|nr:MULTISPECIES: hypothetical protein [Nocardioides]